MTEWTGIRTSVILLGILVVLVCEVESRAQIPDELKLTGCPQVQVVGPAGVTNPGDMAWFVVVVSPEPKSELKFHWTVSAGTVNEGQSARKIGVRYLMEMRGTTLTATVNVEGLPSQCRNSASDSAPLIWDPGPELISEFSVPIGSINTNQLKIAAAELNQNPNSQMYIIEYFPPSTSEPSKKRKKERIRSFMAGTLKFDVSRITIVTSEADSPTTKIYRIPPGASNPNP